MPNGKTSMFRQQKEGMVIGYRTRRAGHIDKYRDGRVYSADWFSTSETECHPGLYLWPTKEEAVDWSWCDEIISVVTKAVDVHQAGHKWRCRWFQVVGKV